MRKLERKLMIIPCLDAKMTQAGASARALSTVTGLHVDTINDARKGRPVVRSGGLWMIAALKLHAFPKKERKPRKFVPRVIIPCLVAKMKLLKATNYCLSLEAGVSQETITRARRGEALLLHTGQYILEALNTRFAA